MVIPEYYVTVLELEGKLPYISWWLVLEDIHVTLVPRFFRIGEEEVRVFLSQHLFLESQDLTVTVHLAEMDLDYPSKGTIRMRVICNGRVEKCRKAFIPWVLHSLGCVSTVLKVLHLASANF